MPLTIAQAEQIGVARTGAVLINAQISASPETDASPRAYMADPIRQALRDLGYGIANPTAPTDADLAQVLDQDENAFADVMELRLLETGATAIEDVNFKADETSLDAASYGERLERRIERLEKRVRIKYGIGASAVAMGRIGLAFQTKSPDAISWE